MDQTNPKVLSWVPWKKLNKIMPIRRNPGLKFSDHAEINHQGEKFTLPKLNVTKICSSSMRQRSPKRIACIKVFAKAFSPVLSRGRTSEFSYKNRNIST